jgi:opacity protein-like surface antigen
MVLHASPLVGQLPVFVTASAGASFDVDERDPAHGGGFAFLTGVGLHFRRVAFGAEFGHHALGGDRKAKQYGAFLRLAATSGRRINPYVIVGVAGYRYSPATGTRTQTVGGSLGPGLGFSLIVPNVRIVLEGRYHTSLDRIGTISSQEFMAVALGLEFRL